MGENMKRFKSHIVIILLLMMSIGWSTTIRAEVTSVYPVELSAVVTPPFGTCLADYVKSGRFQLHALLRDFTKTKVNFKIEMRIRTVDGKLVFQSHIGNSLNFELSPGHPIMLPNETNHSFINELLKQENVRVNKTSSKTNCFDEGAYVITFQAYEAWGYPMRRIPVSREASVTVFMKAGDEKIYLITPYDGDTVCGNVNYLWQPAKYTGGTLKYHMEVAQVPEGHSGYGIFTESATRAFREDNLMVSMKQDVDQTHYTKGATYAWRVTADYGVAGKAISEVRTFVYCGTPKPLAMMTESRKINSKLDTLKIIKANDSLFKTDPADPTRQYRLVVDNPVTVECKYDEESIRKKYCNVNIEIRKHGASEWTPYSLYNPCRMDGVDTVKHKFTDLSYNTTYELRAQYVKCKSAGEKKGSEDTPCGELEYGPYGEVKKIYIENPPIPSDCGEDIASLTDCGEAGGKEFKVGDTLNANGMLVVIDKIEEQKKGKNAEEKTEEKDGEKKTTKVSSTNTTISGTGVTDSPFTNHLKLQMRFKNIEVNCQGEMVSGEVKSVYDNGRSALWDWNAMTGQGADGGEDNPLGALVCQSSGDVAKMKHGDFMLMKPKTDKKEEKKKNVSTEGNSTQVGGIKEIGNVGMSIKKTANNDVEKTGGTDAKHQDTTYVGKLISIPSSIYSTKGRVTNERHFLYFKKNDDESVAFDDGSEAVYRKIAATDYVYYDDPGRHYRIPWLATTPGRLTKLRVTDEYLRDGGEDYEEVKFLMRMKDESPESTNTYLELKCDTINKEREKREYVVYVPGTSDTQISTQVIAVGRKKNDAKYEDAGMMMVANYAEKVQKVKLVPVGGTQQVDEESVAKEMNKTYNKLGVKIEVSLDPPFEDESLSLLMPDGKLNIGTTSTFSKLSYEMKMLKKLYYESNRERIEKGTTYFFLVPELVMTTTDADGKETETSVEGDMPRDQSVGCISMKKTNRENLGRVLSHELGHGMFSLQHTFDYGDATSRGKTKNLMDYGGGTDFAHFQWRLIQHPTWAWSFLQDDEDGFSMVPAYDYLPISKEVYDRYDNSMSNNDYSTLSSEEYFNWHGKEEEKILYVTPNGEILELPATYHPSFTGKTMYKNVDERIPLGCLTGFYDGESYYRSKYEYRDSRYIFLGYFNDNDDKYDAENKTQTQHWNATVMVGIENEKRCECDFYKVAYSGSPYLGVEHPISEEKITLPEEEIHDCFSPSCPRWIGFYLLDENCTYTKVSLPAGYSPQGSATEVGATVYGKWREVPTYNYKLKGEEYKTLKIKREFDYPVSIKTTDGWGFYRHYYPLYQLESGTYIALDFYSNEATEEPPVLYMSNDLKNWYLADLDRFRETSCFVCDFRKIEEEAGNKVKRVVDEVTNNIKENKLELLFDVAIITTSALFTAGIGSAVMLSVSTSLNSWKGINMVNKMYKGAQYINKTKFVKGINQIEGVYSKFGTKADLLVRLIGGKEMADKYVPATFANSTTSIILCATDNENCLTLKLLDISLESTATGLSLNFVNSNPLTHIESILDVLYVSRNIIDIKEK